MAAPKRHDFSAHKTAAELDAYCAGYSKGVDDMGECAKKRIWGLTLWVLFLAAALAVSVGANALMIRHQNATTPEYHP